MENLLNICQHDFVLIIRILLVAGLTVAAVINDLYNYKISNRLIIAGLIPAVMLLVYELVNHGDIFNYLSGMVTVFAALFVVYVLRGIGAGDVKLLSIIGLTVGMDVIWKIVVLSFFSAGITGIVENIPYRGSNCRTHKMHFSIAVLCGEIIYAVISLL